MLKLKPYKVNVVQELLPADCPKRVVFCQWLLDDFDGNTNIGKFDNFFFSDEAWFTLDSYINSQLYRVWSTDNPHSYVDKALHPPQIGVWCAMTRKRICWDAEFKTGCTSTEEEPHGTCWREATRPEMIEKKIHKVVLEDSRIKVREIAEAISISSEWVWVHNILHEHLGTKKLCTIWVLCLLKVNKNNVERISMDNLRLFNRNPMEFLCRFITTDET